MSIGENCKLIRKKRGISQIQLANKVGVNQSMIAHIENGNKIPSVALLWEISIALGVTINDFCESNALDGIKNSTSKKSSKASMSFGTQVKHLRQKNNLRQQDLADRFHVSQQAIAKWENEEAEPDILTLIKLSEFFGVSVDMLLGIEHVNDGLLRCPFCGGEAKFRTGVDKPSNIPVIQLSCQKCGIKTPWCLDTAFDGSFIDEVKKIWNRRTK
jgi:Lar family restriction alleviation protein